MVVSNPKRFWTIVKSVTKERASPNVLRDGQKTVTDPVSKANLMNSFSTLFFQQIHLHPLYIHARDPLVCCPGRSFSPQP